ncbi:Nucleolar protein 12 [Penicillium angulare]|uniref:Nucleolar protein 12 n=1 Tax=Penicillium angulare TaxID=116970 RepID=UPI002541BBC0|nr:Nucleolar protein 12 [Penicillium angulare]KAJ5291894.1 Nucleolar protein 12 [Penicillium angulare]
MGPYFNNKKRRVTVDKVEEVNFDNDARHEYLTGFHKRKVQRAKHAQDIAEKKMKEEKRQDRKRLREERAADFNRVMEEHKRQLKRMKEENDSESSGSDDEDDQEWEGIEEPPAVDYEAEYIDEDKYTTVTVEEMDTSREGLLKSVRGEDYAEEEAKKAPAETAEPEKKPAKKSWKSDKPKKKKKQFRYESKTDRKLTAAKQRASKSKKAKARREE